MAIFDITQLKIQNTNGVTKTFFNFLSTFLDILILSAKIAFFEKNIFGPFSGLKRNIENRIGDATYN